MFECSRCTTRALRALIQDAPLHLRRPSALTGVQRMQRRNAIAISQANIDRDDENLPFDNETKALGISPVPRRHLELELRWLNDKVKLAQHIRELLIKKNEPDKALALVQEASKSRENDHVVAWNYLLRYIMDQGQTEKAFSIFNDMKKRGQRPDSHTYLLMLKGFGITKHTYTKPSARDMARAKSIYDSMSASISKVKPAIIHANAALQACSLVSDMEGVWSIISRLDEEGPNAADAFTYTVLFNALRTSNPVDRSDPNSRASSAGARLESARQGREQWINITKQWKQGRLELDEKLVIAMAQLLLSSPAKEDWDDVLNLINQVFDIPRAVPQNREGELDHSQSQHKTLQKDEHFSKAFEPFEDRANGTPRRYTLRRPKPGPGTLSVVIRACKQLHMTTHDCKKYWDMLTKDIGVRPDNMNLVQMLQFCAFRRASKLVALILEETSQAHDKPRAKGSRQVAQTILSEEVFLTAMLACSRDNKNLNAVQHAGQIVDIATRCLREPCVPILKTYLSLAMNSEDGKIITDAVDRLNNATRQLGSMIGKEPRVDRAAWVETMRQGCELISAIIAAIDTSMVRKFALEGTHKALTDRKREMGRLLESLRTGLREHLSAKDEKRIHNSTPAQAAPKHRPRITERASSHRSQSVEPSQAREGLPAYAV